MDVGVTFGQFSFSYCRPLLLFFYIKLYFTSDCRDQQSETVLSWECKVSLTLIYCKMIKEQKSLSSISFCTCHVAEQFPLQMFLIWKLFDRTMNIVLRKALKYLGENEGLYFPPKNKT